jgi:fructose-specific phosphotransferase system IIC component
MTFTAVLCVFLVYVGVKWTDQVISQVGNTNNGLWSLVKVPLALAIGVGVVLLVGASDFAASQEFMGKTLDTLNGQSQAIAGLLVGAASVGLDTTFKTIRNVGENDTTDGGQGTDQP